MPNASDNRAAGALPFLVKDCALVTLATGRCAHNLRELHQHLQQVEIDSVFHHFWSRLLRPTFDDPEYNNDFAVWAKHALHDQELAERLAILDPTSHPTLEALRQEVVEIVEERLDQSELAPWARADRVFTFLRGQVVVFDTHFRADAPEDLLPVIRRMPLGSIYYHVIEARQRGGTRSDDFSMWLAGLGARYDALREDLEAIDPFFTSLTPLRERLAGVLEAHLGASAVKGGR